MTTWTYHKGAGSVCYVNEAQKIIDKSCTGRII